MLTSALSGLKYSRDLLSIAKTELQVCLFKCSLSSPKWVVRPSYGTLPGAVNFIRNLA